MTTRPAYLVARRAALVVLLCLTLRLLYLASHLETGLSTLATQWRNSTLSWLLGPYIPISERPPTEQADFWLAETDRILREHPSDARLNMAAALVLDSPGLGFLRSHLQAIRLFSGYPYPELDNKAIARAREEFENRCKSRCLKLAANATDLDPKNLDWWRLRAILLFRETSTTPRDPNWLQLLDDFASHDPANALYDYLAADRLWTQGTKWVSENNKPHLQTLNEATFDEAARRFNRAQTKPFLAIGDAGFTATAELLDLANLARTDHPDILNSREIHSRRTWLIHSVWRWQFFRADRKVIDGDISPAIAVRRESLHLINQHTAVGRSTAYASNPNSYVIVATVEWMKDIVSKHAGALTPVELAEINALHSDALIEKQILLRAAQMLPKNKPQARRGFTWLGGASSISEILIALAPQTAAALLLSGLFGGLLLSWTGPANVILGPHGYLTALSLAAATTITAFGLAPARIISREAQFWSWTIVVLVFPIIVFAYLGWRYLLHRSFQFTLRAMLTATLIFSVLLAIAVSPPGRALLEDMPFQIAIPPRHIGEANAHSLEEWFTAQGAQAWWAVSQWIAYRGHLWTIAIWAALVGLLHHWKLQRLARRNLLPIFAPTLSRRAAGFLASITRPAFIMSALLLLLYLLLAPHHLQQIDRRFQQDISFARDPDAYWKMVETAVQNVRSNEQFMTEIQKEIQSPTD